MRSRLVAQALPYRRHPLSGGCCQRHAQHGGGLHRRSVLSGRLQQGQWAAARVAQTQAAAAPSQQSQTRGLTGLCAARRAMICCDQSLLTPERPPHLPRASRKRSSGSAASRERAESGPPCPPTSASLPSPFCAPSRLRLRALKTATAGAGPGAGTGVPDTCACVRIARLRGGWVMSSVVGSLLRCTPLARP